MTSLLHLWHLFWSEHKTRRAAYALGNLALKSTANDLMVRRGVISRLVALLRNGTQQQKNAAASALENLVRVTYSDPADISRETLAEPLVLVGSQEQKESAACTLMRICASNDALRTDIEQNGGVSFLMALLRAACALHKLAGKDAPRAEIVRENGIAALVELLRLQLDEQKESSAKALMTITKANDAARADVAREGGIMALVSILKSGTDQQKYYAAGVLGNLARNWDCIHLDIVRGGAAAPLVVLLRSERINRRTLLHLHSETFLPSTMIQAVLKSRMKGALACFRRL
ncbi:unnamed protein product [Phytophthora lilii]|uniref:Unnamed protein product n=1 Tax=Phytophthora lilii TaxID=2077276 RepID=A0A9W6TS15_9STRA|nr:unnamed protein product [Phytophthora lilii]